MVPHLHVLTRDDTRLEQVRAVVSAGAPLLQVRLKTVGDREALQRVRDVLEVTRPADAACLVDDRVDVAVAADADGVHLGADDLPVSTARTLVDRDGRGRLVGGTAREPATAVAVAAEGADYLGVGPCYPTTSKTGLPTPGGPERVAAVAAAVDVPVIAIGGVTAARVPELLAAGAHGVAVIGAVWDADDPAHATGELLQALHPDQVRARGGAT